MNHYRTVLIPILISILAFCLVAFQLSIVLRFTFLQGSFYTAIFSKYKVYGYIKEYALNMVKGNLADSEESLPYIEEALSDTWIEKEVNHIIYDFFNFLEGRQNSLPEISGKNIKERLAVILEKSGLEQSDKYVQYWLPIPDAVKLSDITSTKELWEIRVLYHWLSRIPYIFGLAVLLPLIAVLVVSASIHEGYLWVSAGMIGGGTLVIIISAAALYTMSTSMMLNEIVQQVASLGIPLQAAKSILWTSVLRIFYPTIVSGTVCLGFGGLIWVGWKEK